jgi:hypothetical protein
MFIKTGSGLGLALFPKSASSSISNALVPFSEVSPDVFEKLSVRVAFIREPHERAESAYRMFRRERHNCQHDVTSFARFITSICRRFKDDPHVIPQAWLAMRDGKFMPNRVVRWDFDELEKIIGVRVPHSNAGERLPIEWSEKSRDMFDEVFWEDLELWGKNGEGT